MCLSICKANLTALPTPSLILNGMELVVLKPIKPSDMLALSQLSGTVGKPHQWLENQLSTTGHSVPHMMCLRKTSHVCSKWGGSEVVLRVFFHSFHFSTHLKLYSSRLRCFWYPGTAGLIFGVLSLRLSGVELHRGLGEGGRARNLAFRENL